MSVLTAPVRILLVDDHRLLRETLRDGLTIEGDFVVVGEAGDGVEAVAMAAETRPDVVLLDVDMPRHQPVEGVRRLMQVSPGSKVIVLSMYDDPQLVREMLRAGVAGYLHKSVGLRDLAGAIRGATSGQERVTVSVVSRHAFGRPGNNSRPGQLSVREQEVLALVAEALSNRQIAVRLSITEGTVKRHLRNVFDKLGAVSRIDAVNKAAASLTGKRNA